MTHLTPDEVVDAVERALNVERKAHVDDCPACARQVADLSRLVASARAIDVPEPSPLFWERFSDRVRVAIGSEAPMPRRQPWFAWPVLAPLSALALLVVALGGVVSRDAAVRARPDVTADVSPDPEMEQTADGAAVEAVWALAADLVGSFDDIEAQASELNVSPGSAERAAGQLSSAEQAELVRLLQQELGRSGG
jgi:hypothetical protein